MRLVWFLYFVWHFCGSVSFRYAGGRDADIVSLTNDGAIFELSFPSYHDPNDISEVQVDASSYPPTASFKASTTACIQFKCSDDSVGIVLSGEPRVYPGPAWVTSVRIIEMKPGTTLIDYPELLQWQPDSLEPGLNDDIELVTWDIHLDAIRPRVAAEPGTATPDDFSILTGRVVGTKDLKSPQQATAPPKRQKIYDSTGDGQAETSASPSRSQSASRGDMSLLEKGDCVMMKGSGPFIVHYVSPDGSKITAIEPHTDAPKLFKTSNVTKCNAQQAKLLSDLFESALKKPLQRDDIVLIKDFEKMGTYKVSSRGANGRYNLKHQSKCGAALQVSNRDSIIYPVPLGISLSQASQQPDKTPSISEESKASSQERPKLPRIQHPPTYRTHLPPRPSFPKESWVMRRLASEALRGPYYIYGFFSDKVTLINPEDDTVVRCDASQLTEVDKTFDPPAVKVKPLDTGAAVMLKNSPLIYIVCGRHSKGTYILRPEHGGTKVDRNREDITYPILDESLANILYCE